MNLRRRRQGLSTILPNGPQSSYRDFAGQVMMRNMWCRMGRCSNAAIPGTSNHGLGIAVDANNPGGVNSSGADFGWQKRWSDAPWEPWHFKWAGFGKILGPRYYERVIKKGYHGSAVAILKRLLKRAGYIKSDVKPGLWFNADTKKQVKRFQLDHHLKADGVVGPRTWHALRRAANK